MKRKSYDDDEKISLEVRRDRCSEVTRLLLLLLLDCCWCQHNLRRYGRLLPEKIKAMQYITWQRKRQP